MEVGAADAAVAHPELEVARPGLRLRDIDELHPADSLKCNSLHRAPPRARIIGSGGVSVKGEWRMSVVGK
jgi:hypothetical protein